MAVKARSAYGARSGGGDGVVPVDILQDEGGLSGLAAGPGIAAAVVCYLSP